MRTLSWFVGVWPLGDQAVLSAPHAQRFGASTSCPAAPCPINHTLQLRMIFWSLPRGIGDSIRARACVSCLSRSHGTNRCGRFTQCPTWQLGALNSCVAH